MTEVTRPVVGSKVRVMLDSKGAPATVLSYLKSDPEIAVVRYDAAGWEEEFHWYWLDEVTQ